MPGYKSLFQPEHKSKQALSHPVAGDRGLGEPVNMNSRPGA